MKSLNPRGHRYTTSRSTEPKYTKVKWVKLRCKTSTLVQVLDAEDHVLDVLDESRYCGGYASNYGYCGGCDYCQLLQAAHSGYAIKPYRWWRRWVPLAREVAIWAVAMLWMGVFGILCLIYGH